MTNLLFAHAQNQHVVNVTMYTGGGDVDSKYYYYNLLGGKRCAQFKRESPAATQYIYFDYEFDIATEIDTVFIADLKEVINDDWSAVAAVKTRVVVDAGTSSIDTAVYGSGPIDSYNGVFNTDFIAKFTSNTKKLWRVWVVAVESDGSTSAASQYKMSKLFLCKAIDLGREPDSIRQRTMTYSNIYSVDGNLIRKRHNRNLLQFEISYRGITDAALASFKSALDINEQGYMAMFNTTSNLQLGGVNVVYGMVENLSYDKEDYNFNSLSFDFNEQY